MYCSEESGENNYVGASGSIKEQREENKREGRKEGGCFQHITSLSLCRELKNYEERQ